MPARGWFLRFDGSDLYIGVSSDWFQGQWSTKGLDVEEGGLFETRVRAGELVGEGGAEDSGRRKYYQEISKAAFLLDDYIAD